ncbi:MAG TPA: hypothetical protein VFC78_06225 [Tepidisphaeraceae bacterium]|nr:hypothetical protein [Tepidisphaeraceae bacterium]
MKVFAGSKSAARRGRGEFSVRAAAGVAIEAMERRVLLSAGGLDGSFGSGGIVQLPNIIGSFHDVQALPDGRLLAVGSAKGYDGKPALLTARFLPNGTPDQSFGYHGYVIMKYGGFTDGDRVALLSNGQFYVAGSALGRFNSNGLLDPTFGNNGVVSFNDGSSGTKAGLAVQADGKIVITHGVDEYAGRDYRGTSWPGEEVSRYNSNGTLDSTFATGGRFTGFPPDTFNSYMDPNDVTLQGSKILIGVSLGTVKPPGDSYTLFGVERLNANGTVDTTFGVNGLASTYYPDTGDYTQRVEVAPNGNIFLVGTEGDQDFDLDVFTSDGAPASNNAGNTGTQGFSPGLLRIANNGDGADVAFQSDGKPVLFGDVQVYGNSNGEAPFVERLNTDLSKDSTFTAPSQVSFPAGPGSNLFFAGGGAIEPNGGIVEAGAVGGYAQGNAHGVPIIGTPTLLRFLGDSSAPPAAASAQLGADGILRVNGTAGNDVIRVTRSVGNVIVNINNAGYGAFSAASIKQIDVYGLDGNDWINVDAGNIPAMLDGGAGNDTLWGGGGPNTLMGGAGDDILTPHQGVSNVIIGGGGTDAVNYSHYTRGVTVRLDGLNDSGLSGEADTISTDISIIYGSQFNDLLFGNFGAGGAAGTRDSLFGNGGNDTLIAGNGGDGNDLLLSRNGVKDFLDGGAGNNTAHIDAGLDSAVNIQQFQP